MIYKEHDRVRILSKDLLGTIISVHNDGEAYTVEYSNQFATNIRIFHKDELVIWNKDEPFNLIEIGANTLRQLEQLGWPCSSSDIKDYINVLLAEKQRMSQTLRAINNRLFGSDSDTCPGTIDALEKLIQRAYSTDYAWQEISKMVERAAREVGDLKLENEKLRKKISELNEIIDKLQ